MKKAISVTLNGVVFDIEEDAFCELDKYLDSIKKFYKSPEEEKEILADIEAGIADKFSEKINSKKKVITLHDVEDVVEIMGTVDQIKEDDTGEKVESEKEIETSWSKKRLYRDPDNAMIAGVCSGIAAYFGIDPVLIRLIFVVLFFAQGIGLLAYIIFWLIVPTAKSSTQKLEMHGRPVNLNEIQEVVKNKSKMIADEGKQAIDKIKKRGTIYKILDFPFRFLEAIFNALKKCCKAILPFSRVFFGIIFLMSTSFAILGLSIAAGIAMFNIDLLHHFSEITFYEITGSIFYYLLILAVYLIALVPILIIFFLSISMLKKKNVLTAILSGVLVSIWMLAVVAGIVSVGKLAPVVEQKVIEINQIERESRSLEYSDFSKLYLSLKGKAIVERGDEFKIEVTGRGKVLDNLETKIEDGQLQIMQKDLRDFCIFCPGENVEVKITMPRLESFVAINRTEAEIKGFAEDIYMSIGESSKTDLYLSGQNVSGMLAGVSSRLNLIGEANNLDFEMIGHSRLIADDLKANDIKLKAGVFSDIELSGEAVNLEADLAGFSDLKARELQVEIANITAKKQAEAEIFVTQVLNATIYDYAEVEYHGTPEVNVEKLGEGILSNFVEAGEIYSE